MLCEVLEVEILVEELVLEVDVVVTAGVVLRLSHTTVPVPASTAAVLRPNSNWPS